jgi:hypothetical protein
MTEQAAIQIATSWLEARGFDRFECFGPSYCGPYHGYETVLKLRDEGCLDISPNMLEESRRRNEAKPSRPYWLVNFSVERPSDVEIVSVRVDDASGQITDVSLDSEHERAWTVRLAQIAAFLDAKNAARGAPGEE